MKKYLTAKNILITLVFLTIFFLALRPPLDPDLGWHIKNGEYIWQNMALPQGDVFSHTMPGYPWIPHEWFLDTLFYLIYNKAGLIPLALIFAFLTVIVFFLAASTIKAKVEYQVLAALIGTIASLPIIGIRPQMLTMLGLALTFFILYRFRENPKGKIIYFLPLLFFLWANLHAGFSIGFLAIGLFGFFEILKILGKIVYQKIWKKELLTKILSLRNWLKLIVFTLISIGTTLINPYGIRIYQEIINTLSDTYVLARIAEWQPLQFRNPMSYQFAIFVFLLFLLLIFAFRRLDFTHVGIAGCFLYLAFSSWRHLPLFIIAAIPFWVILVEFLTGPTLANLLKKKLILIIFAIALIVIVRQQIKGTWPLYIDPIKAAQRAKNPYKAIQFLKENPLEGNMFNEYDWGGYLIWHYPEKKVFIDGRMAIWKTKEKAIFRDYQEIMEGKNVDELLFEYQVKWALLHNNRFLVIVLKSKPDWEIVYQDELSTILAKREK